MGKGQNGIREELGEAGIFPEACWPRGAPGLPLPSLGTALS